MNPSGRMMKPEPSLRAGGVGSRHECSFPLPSSRSFPGRPSRGKNSNPLNSSPSSSTTFFVASITTTLGATFSKICTKPSSI